MPSPRNDTLGAKIIDVIYLNDCDSNLCLEWQYHQIIATSIMILIVGAIIITVTYQLCCSKHPKSSNLNSDIKCISITYLYCLLISYILLLLISIFIYKPTVTGGGWEYSEQGGWFYDDNTPGWEWDNNGWEWNDNASWQWTSGNGWYYTGEYTFNPGWFLAVFLFFGAFYILVSVGHTLSYLYPFRRLYNSFQGSQYALSDSSVNGHYLISGIIFFLSLIGSMANFTLNHLMVNRMLVAQYVFYSIGLGFMMYQFNKRLLDIVTAQHQHQEFASSHSESNMPHPSSTTDHQEQTEPTADEIQKSAIQMQLIYAVVKHSVLAGTQLVTFGLCAIVSIIHMVTTNEDEQVWSIGVSHIVSLWSATISSLCIAICIFLGLSINEPLYNKLCFCCHRQCNKICDDISSKQILRNANKVSTMVRDERKTESKITELSITTTVTGTATSATVTKTESI